MLKKIFIPLFLVLLSSTVYAEEQNNNTIEDKYSACEKKYDECLLKCEESENVSVCLEKCEENLYYCNKKVQELEFK